MKNKENFGKLKKEYNKIPNAIETINFSANAKAMFMTMVSLPPSMDPSIGFLSKRLKMARTTVCRTIAELEAHNIIRKYSQGNSKRVSKYEFVNYKQWKVDIT